MSLSGAQYAIGYPNTGIHVGRVAKLAHGVTGGQQQVNYAIRRWVHKLGRVEEKYVAG